MRIYYEISERRCLSKCPFVKNIQIGSIACQKCEHNSGSKILKTENINKSKGKQLKLYVECNYKQKVGGENGFNMLLL